MALRLRYCQHSLEEAPRHRREGIWSDVGGGGERVGASEVSDGCQGLRRGQRLSRGDKETVKDVRKDENNRGVQLFSS